MFLCRLWKIEICCWLVAAAANVTASVLTTKSNCLEDFHINNCSTNNSSIINMDNKNNDDRTSSDGANDNDHGAVVGDNIIRITSSSYIASRFQYLH